MKCGATTKQPKIMKRPHRQYNKQYFPPYKYAFHCIKLCCDIQCIESITLEYLIYFFLPQTSICLRVWFKGNCGRVQSYSFLLHFLESIKTFLILYAMVLCSSEYAACCEVRKSYIAIQNAISLQIFSFHKKDVNI